jgi:uncharacterized membrane protein
MTQTGAHPDDPLTKAGLWVRAHIRQVIVVQTVVLVVWIAINAIAIFGLRWDPYPFILLNLALSFQAAYTGPLLLLSDDIAAASDAALQQQQLEILETVRKTQGHQDRLLETLERLVKRIEKEERQQLELEKPIPEPPPA